MNYNHEITSTISYLIGLDKKFFKPDEEERTFAAIERFEQLEKNRPAKILRSLCMMRNGFMNNFKYINQAIKGESSGIRAGIHGLYEYVDEDAIKFLETCSIKFKYTSWAADYIVEINKYIIDRVNNCKGLFQEFVNWQYVKNFIVMPNGTTENGCKEAADIFYANKECYPFFCYVNWRYLDVERGKSLFNDFIFMSNLYEDNKDSFEKPELVCTNSDESNTRIANFLIDSDTEVIIDCENANPFFIYSFLQNISDENYDKISKIILFNDVNASSAWTTLAKTFDDIEFEEVLCERVVERKSLVDAKLITRTVKEYYVNNIKSFILVSSDSDFYGMIEELSDANFMLVMERKQTSFNMIETAESNGISYIYSEDYPYSDAYDFMKTVINADLRKAITEHFTPFCVSSKIDEISRDAFADLSDSEKESIMKNIVKNTKVVFDENYCLKVIME